MPTARIRYKQSRLKQLRGFCYAAQTGSISQAAKKMFLSQPSVSLQIQALEQDFDAILFERKGPNIVLTPEGKVLYEMALPLVEGIDKLKENFDATREEVKTGPLDIAAGESTILYILPKFVERFTRTYPHIELKLNNVTGRNGMDLLRRGEVDFAVGSMIEIPEDILYHALFTYDPVLIAPHKHPLAGKKDIRMKDISQHPLILPPRHLSTWRIVNLVFEQHNLSYQVKLEAGGWEVIKKYVELGLGISIVTSICLTGTERLETIPVGKYFPKRTYGVVLRKGKILSPQAKRFIEMMREGAQGMGTESGKLF